MARPGNRSRWIGTALVALAVLLLFHTVHAQEATFNVQPGQPISPEQMKAMMEACTRDLDGTATADEFLNVVLAEMG